MQINKETFTMVRPGCLRNELELMSQAFVIFQSGSSTLSHYV